jgi:hypothetical protein
MVFLHARTSGRRKPCASSKVLDIEISSLQFDALCASKEASECGIRCVDEDQIISAFDLVETHFTPARRRANEGGPRAPMGNERVHVVDFFASAFSSFAKSCSSFSMKSGVEAVTSSSPLVVGFSDGASWFSGTSFQT